MFENVTDLSEKLTDEAGGRVDTEAGPVAELLTGAETPRYALTSDSVEHVTEGRTTTVQPEGSHDAYLIVTDERVMLVLGDQPGTAEIEFDLTAVTRCNLKSGFLSSTLTVGHEAESINFSPSGGDAEAFAEDVRVLSDVHRSVEAALETARETAEELERRISEDGEEEDLRLRLQSQLSEARHHATREDDVPTARLLDRIGDVAEQLNRKYVEAWLRRAREDIPTAKAALEDDDYETFCTAYTTSVAALERVDEALEELEHIPEETVEAAEELADDVDAIDDSYLAAARDAHERAAGTDDPAAAVTDWLEAYDRYAAARGAGWRDVRRLNGLPPDDELSSIVVETVEALEADATRLAEEGEAHLEDDADHARERYERAADRLRRAAEIADRWAVVDDENYAERIADLEERIEVTEWEWGAG